MNETTVTPIPDRQYSLSHTTKACKVHASVPGRLPAAGAERNGGADFRNSTGHA